MIIKIRVKPDSGKQEIVEIDGKYLFYHKQKAVRGRANAELMNLLSKRFKTSVKNISVRGKTSRDKIVEIRQ